MSQPTPRWQLFKHWQGLKVWEQWMIATVIAQLVSLGILTAANTITHLTTSTNIYIVLILVGTLQGGILGFAQWLVLRRYIRHIGWWIGATIVGTILAWGVGTMVDVFIAVFIAFSTPVGTAKTSATLEGVLALLGLWLKVYQKLQNKLDLEAETLVRRLIGFAYHPIPRRAAFFF